MRVPSRPPTVFVGGGTPTFLPPDLLERLFAGLRAAGAFDDPLVEVTVEANPESATEERLRLLREAGANRLSIGAQSFDAEQLKAFDRVHSAGDVAAAVHAARRAGFERINLDLIFAKPGETLDLWVRDLEAALALGTDHVSCYELSFEEGTALFRDRARGRVAEQQEDERAAFYRATIDRLAGSGHAPYEISAFARPGFECRHNLVYWTGGDWIGVGAGAATSLGARRFMNRKSPEAYAASMMGGGSALDPETQEDADPRMRLAELLMMGLRLVDGIAADSVHRRCGLDPLVTLRDEISQLVDDGLLRVEARRLVPTERGRFLGNIVAMRLLP